jgi:hypothetical protein
LLSRSRPTTPSPSSADAELKRRLVTGTPSDQVNVFILDQFEEHCTRPVPAERELVFDLLKDFGGSIGRDWIANRGFSGLRAPFRFQSIASLDVALVNRHSIRSRPCGSVYSLRSTVGPF